DPEQYEFVNFGIDEARDGLIEFCGLVRSVNPTVRILLTVSPVPLVAAFEPRHVVVSTTYSKAVLRVAAEEATRQCDFVDYFPSYEIIATAAAGRSYYRPDLREVDDTGVRHVMRCFSAHYVEGRPWDGAPVAMPAGAAQSGDVVCDEDAVADAIQRSSESRPPANRGTGAGGGRGAAALPWSPANVPRTVANGNGAKADAGWDAKRAWQATKRRARRLAARLSPPDR